MLWLIILEIIWVAIVILLLVVDERELKQYEKAAESYSNTIIHSAELLTEEKIKFINSLCGADRDYRETQEILDKCAKETRELANKKEDK